MALVLLEKGETEQAKRHYKKGVQLSEKMNNPTTVKVLKEIKNKAGF